MSFSKTDVKKIIAEAQARGCLDRLYYFIQFLPRGIVRNGEGSIVVIPVRIWPEWGGDQSELSWLIAEQFIRYARKELKAVSDMSIGVLDREITKGNSTYQLEEWQEYRDEICPHCGGVYDMSEPMACCVDSPHAGKKYNRRPKYVIQKEEIEDDIRLGVSLGDNFEEIRDRSNS